MTTECSNIWTWYWKVTHSLTHNHSQVTASEINQEYSRATITCSHVLFTTSPCALPSIFIEITTFTCTWTPLSMCTHTCTQKFSLSLRAEAVILVLHSSYCTRVSHGAHTEIHCVCAWFRLTDRWWLRGRWALSHLQGAGRWMDGGEMGGKSGGRQGWKGWS